jgi:two-component system response regulator PilR (NtrC family)
VVDDEPDIRDAMDLLLVSVGYDVATAESGAVALARASGEAFDLVITDLRMPGMSGIDTVAGLRQAHPSLPIIVVSGYASDECAARCLEQGGVWLVNKPVDVDELLNVVAIALRGVGGARDPGYPCAP